LKIVTGGETDTFSEPPVPVELQVDSVDSSGAKQTLATASLPVSNVDLGAVDQSAEGTLQVTGRDTNGDSVLYGQTLPIQFGSLDGANLPIFVQRTGEFARMPNPFSADTRATPTLAIVSGRYLFIGGGSDSSPSTTAQLYDFASYDAVAPALSLPLAPESVVWVGTVAWLINNSGAASFDLSDGTTAEVTAPSGGAFGDVAGGATVAASDGSQYVVGATRSTGSPTKAVLAIDPSGNATWVTLTEPRLGAAATWVEGSGLVVAGGSADAAGVEIVASGMTTGVALDYPPDASTGSGAAMLDGTHVLLGGGATPTGEDAGVRSIDLTCSMQCAPSPWAALGAPLPLTPAQVFASDPANALLIGDDPSGITRAFWITATIASAVGTKVTHMGARGIVSPLGSVVIFGGSGEIESFVPSVVP
jgi:hypothetical protein